MHATDDADAPTARGESRSGPSHSLPTFHRLVANTLASSITSTFLWFSLTFWVYVETRSVVATGVIGGAFMLTSAVGGPPFGTLVDRHRKHSMMTAATAVSLAAFVVAGTIYATLDTGQLLSLTSPWFWTLAVVTLVGSVAGQLRGIALITTVTLLVPEERRDRANGLVGTVTGVSFAVTSVFSGLVIGGLGMGWAYAGAIGLAAVTLAHLRTITVDESTPHRDDNGTHLVDVRGALDAIAAVPGLWLLIGIAAVNNLLGGVFMALMDAYGLELVTVEVWGLLWGFLSLAFIAGGMIVARWGLGSSPVRLIVAANLVNWTVCSVFALRSSIVLLSVGMLVWLTLIPVVEAAEQTVLQRSVPYERHGRVFGFAQLLENAASPLTAFLMAPLAETVFIPLMTTGRGADTIGDWFGTGADRGIALMFTIAGAIGIIATLAARLTRSYRLLRDAEPDQPRPPASVDFPCPDAPAVA